MTVLNFLAKASLVCALSLSFSNNVVASASKNEVSLNFDLPPAVGMSRGTLVIDGKQFTGMSKYFKKVDALPKADIPYDVTPVDLATAFDKNEIAMVSMNDSCLAKPDSGVELLSLDGLNDCVGVFVFHKDIGAGAAHITMGTNLPSLDSIFDPYVGEEDVQITLLTSYKTSLLNKLSSLVAKKGLAVTSLFVNNAIQQMNKEGTVLKRFMDPADFPGLEDRVAPLGKSVQLLDIADILGNKVSSPIGAVMNAKTGHISFIEAAEGRESALHVSSAQLTSLREFSLKIRNWSTMRYLRDVKPFEDKMGVDIAFVQYPVS